MMKKIAIVLFALFAALPVAAEEREQTQLHYFAQGGLFAPARDLVAAGADVNAQDKYGNTPLHLAAGTKHKDIVAMLIFAGAEIDAKDNGGRTPLHGAALNGRKEVAGLLIEKGADVNVKDKRGRTPLWMALLGGHADLVDWLRSMGAKL